MDDGPAGHAMTEIALALAMSFFCLLVLTLVSMGTPAPESAAPARLESLASAPAGGATEQLAVTDRLVVFHDGRFIDAERRPVDPGRLGSGGRVVLAIDPALPMADVLAARRRVARTDVVVTPLDATWLAALGGESGR